MGTQADMIDIEGSRKSTPTRVVSRDGTEIAYWTGGDGPPLLLVHGTGGVHERFAPLLPYLVPHATVHVMDRRGRGASGDAPVYALEREHEDVAAVVDAIAAASGSSVDVYGHSYGGECVFGAALLTDNIRRAVLYEGWPPVTPEKVYFPRDVEERLDRLVAAGDRDGGARILHARGRGGVGRGDSGHSGTAFVADAGRRRAHDHSRDPGVLRRRLRSRAGGTNQHAGTCRGR